MACIGVRNLQLSFGGPLLLDGIDLHVEEGDRLCLLGRNGAGKSSFLKVLAGELDADGGEIARQKGCSVAYLGQELPEELDGTALKIASGGDIARELAAQQFLSQFGIDPKKPAGQMSGGEKRRVLLSRLFATGAQLLLLDEPTNHLDIESIAVLEELLERRAKSMMFITHDRYFAKRLANRVAEIDRGRLYSFKTGYDDFLRRREELLEAEQKARDRFDKRLAEEEAWLRRGIKARRTRNEGRVRSLLKMRDSYRQRRVRSGSVQMEISRGERIGDLILEAKGLSFSYDDSTPIVNDFTTIIMRGDRVGICGVNGAGKSTLLKLLLGQLEPDSGKLRKSDKLQVLYLDQLRSELDPDLSIWENVAGDGDSVVINGRKKHVVSYLEDFLFSSERVKQPVSHLSGGERNRLLLAKLFARPSNLLVLDEPTNDLDVETLELLEELLQEYPGTILLVSHDRSFLDNVVSECFVFAGDGKIVEYAGGYSDWFESEAKRKIEEARGGVELSDRSNKSGERRQERRRKLTYREKQELTSLPERIEELDAEKERIHAELADPELYREDGAAAAEKGQRLEEIDGLLEQAYERWEELEALGN